MSRQANRGRPWEEISGPPETVVLDVTRCCHPIGSSVSAIDAFYDTTAETLTLGKPELLAESPTLGRLLILGLVTGTEGYFRSAIHGVATICPLAKEEIADQMIALGAVDFYGANQASLGLFEKISFASEGEVKKRTKQLLGLSIQQNDSVGVALENYEQVCHMRHAAVHSQGVLNRGNARALGVGSRPARLHLVIDMAHLHLAAKVCMSVVRAYNRFVYAGILQKWLDEKILTGVWRVDKPYFSPLFELLCSKVDGVAAANAYQAYLSLKPDIIKRLS